MAKANSLYEKLECSVCLDYLEIPIKQCVIGHSFCSKCLNKEFIKLCPECRSDILETRNYKLEEIIKSMSFPCDNKTAGCPYLLPKNLLADHALECKFRSFKCEGRRFCDWECDWEGRDLLEHFKNEHRAHTLMEYNTRVTLPYNSTSAFTDVQLISAHYQLFWYKHKIDIVKKQALWAFQYIGPKIQASYYYYEFEIFNEDDVRRYKVIEYCRSDIDNIDIVFDSEKCVVVSFKTLKTYTNEKDEYSFRFRLMKKKKEEAPAKSIRVPVIPKPDMQANTNVSVKQQNLSMEQINRNRNMHMEQINRNMHMEQINRNRNMHMGRTRNVPTYPQHMQDNTLIWLPPPFLHPRPSHRRK